MSSTITCHSRAAALKDPAGDVFYALFEETYESNVYPQIPHWSCVHFGGLDSAIKRVFNSAASCEGGMLRDRGGDITPEGYIARWMKELATPLVLENRRIALKISDSWRASVPTANGEAVAALLHRTIPLKANALRNGAEVYLDLMIDSALLTRILGITQTGPWRLIDTLRSDTDDDALNRRRQLGYDPAPAKNPAFDIPQAVRLNRDDIIMPDADGRWRFAGQQYSILGDYIRTLGKRERAEPKAYKKRIAAYRAALAATPAAPTGLTALVVPPADELPHAAARRLELTADPSASGPSERFTVAPTKDNLYALTSLPPNAVEWLFPHAAAA